jgi:hypothetical protein
MRLGLRLGLGFRIRHEAELGEGSGMGAQASRTPGEVAFPDSTFTPTPQEDHEERVSTDRMPEA